MHLTDFFLSPFSKEVNEEFIQELAKKVRQFEQENKNLREDTGDVESLNEESAKVLSDIKGTF